MRGRCHLDLREDGGVEGVASPQSHTAQSVPDSAQTLAGWSHPELVGWGHWEPRKWGKCISSKKEAHVRFVGK